MRYSIAEQCVTEQCATVPTAPGGGAPVSEGPNPAACAARRCAPGAAGLSALLRACARRELPVGVVDYARLTFGLLHIRLCGACPRQESALRMPLEHNQHNSHARGPLGLMLSFAQPAGSTARLASGGPHPPPHPHPHSTAPRSLHTHLRTGHALAPQAYLPPRTHMLSRCH